MVPMLKKTLSSCDHARGKAGFKSTHLNLIRPLKYNETIYKGYGAHQIYTRADNVDGISETGAASSAPSNDQSEYYEFTYTGNDGRKKATFEQALKGGKIDAWGENAPWNMGYQMGEKALVWNEDMKKRLYLRVASSNLGITEEELEQHLDRLRVLLPDASDKINSMPVQTLSRLISSLDDIPQRLMHLKITFPNANASILAIRNPELVLGFDEEHLGRIAEELRGMFPRLDIDRLVQENPSMLDIEELKVAMAEAKRIMPNLDIQQAMGSDPHLILSFQRGQQLIPYDSPYDVSQEEEQVDDDEYNQYYR